MNFKAFLDAAYWWFIEDFLIAIYYLLFGVFIPGWKKEARAMAKGARKFVHYKRDLLAEDRIAEIESRRRDLLETLKTGDKGAAAEAGKQLQATCEQALPKSMSQTWWEENLEVLFVAMVIALGLRTYVVQPFRIPTGSMQPTLNGIVIINEGADYKAPWVGKRVWDYVIKGRSYHHIVADNTKRVTGMRDKSWFLFTRTEVSFDDGSKIKIPSAEGEVAQLISTTERKGANGESVTVGKTFQKGEAILSGTVTTGDLVLVDRISYHFRRPKRGEVFVFDTRGIPTSGDVTAQLRGQTGGSHYIKRLCGIPGDALSIDTPNLLNHGRILHEPGIARVAERKGKYAVDYHGRKKLGYHVAGSYASEKYLNAPLVKPGDVFELKKSKKRGLNQYAALGDNTGNSLDSRYWGPVHEFNLLGPGFVSLWPFSSGHWGRIR